MSTGKPWHPPATRFFGKEQQMTHEPMYCNEKRKQTTINKIESKQVSEEQEREHKREQERELDRQADSKRDRDE
jgi:hypothetical protein